jgi:hypothetical protein
MWECKEAPNDPMNFVDPTGLYGDRSSPGSAALQLAKEYAPQAASLVLDSLPVIGALKGGMQVISGTDLLTGVRA